ncbi:condensin complex subunit 3-like isoform X1 [Sitophilus oryzae]|uniref:Condensin complex subunit 3-like isoform X1 n=1 Tax=Sitophilus oryzae TaxID=7048 RepID=A0A6J2YGF8_SITOR|nr:condensin complex subunit 3-like isoform X1 [Sitophilus oryzae]
MSSSRNMTETEDINDENLDYLIHTISEILTASQVTKACHQRNVSQLSKLLETTDVDLFFKAFQYPLCKVLKTDIKAKNPFCDRLVEFLGLFLSHEYRFENEIINEDSLFYKAFKYLLEASQCVDEGIRYKASQTISCLFDNLVGKDINEEIITDLESVFLERLYDSKTAIRLLAIRILYRLQDPDDPENSICNDFLSIIKGDGQARVRELCIEKIILNKESIERLIKRTRDIDTKVRLMAFKKLSNVLRCISISDRRTILISGIFDLSEIIQNYIYTGFLNAWLQSFNYEILDLMESVRLDGDQRDITETENLFKHILTKFYFKSRSLQETKDVLNLNKDKIIPYENLNWETISFWKLFVEFLKENEKFEDEVENVIPEVAYFMTYIKGFLETNDYADNFIEKQFILNQLFHMLKFYDYSDPPTRQSLNKLVSYALKKFDFVDEVVEEIIDCLKLSIPDAELRSRFACEIISDLLYPVDVEQAVVLENQREVKLAKLKTDIIVLQGEQQDAVAKTDYLEAGRLKEKIDYLNVQLSNLKNEAVRSASEEVKKKTDLLTVNNCLNIAFGILRTLGMSQLTSSLKSLKVDVIEEFLTFNNDIVRMKAFRCYAICCIYDKATAMNGIHMFALPIAAYQAGEECDMQLLIVCIGAVVDLIRIYGADLIAEPDQDQLSDSVNEEHRQIFSGGTSLTQLIQGLVDLMDDSQYEIQEIAGKGLCQLILNERIHSSSLLCKLILKWCNPADEDEPETEPLRQLIAYTLGKIPYLSRNLEQLKDAFLLTVRILVSAPKTSPLSEVDIDNVVKFMLALCDSSPIGPHLHSGIARDLCSHMLSKPNSKLNLVYSKILTTLNIPEDPALREDLLDSCETIMEETSTKKVLANLTKFRASLVVPIVEECNTRKTTSVDEVLEIEE